MCGVQKNGWLIDMSKTRDEVDKEFDVQPQDLKPIPRRHLLTPEQTILRNCKVRITMFIDADVLQHFKARAAEPNTTPYQTQINQALRELMERHTDRLATSAASDPLSVFQDKRFIRKLNKHIDERVKSKQHQ